MNKGITLAGNILIDHNREIDLYPSHSELVQINKVYNTVGGSVSNSGISLAKIDPCLPIHFLGIIGDDSDGKFIMDEFRKYPNINLDQIKIGQQNTSFTDVMSDITNNTRTFFSYKGASSELRPEHFDFSKIKTEILHIGYILLLEGLDALDDEYGTKMARVLHLAQKSGIKTSIDVVTENSNRFSQLVPPAVRYTNFCIINEEEAARTVNEKVRDESGKLDLLACKRVCSKLFDLGVKDWVVIHAREGGIGLDKEGNFVAKASLNIPGEDIKGTTGAGDAFLAGALYGAYRKYPIEKAVELGIASSNASLLEAGSTAGVKTEAELFEFYHKTEKEDWDGFN